MNTHLVRVLDNYSRLVTERNSLIQQLAHFKGVSVEDVIDSMYSVKFEGEYRRTRRIVDKTAQIALTYEEHRDKINREWHEHLEKKLTQLDEEIKFFETSIDALSVPIRLIMKDMFINGYTWDYLEEIHNVSRTTIARYRKKALAEMSAFYDLREMMLNEFLSTSDYCVISG